MTEVTLIEISHCKSDHCKSDHINECNTALINACQNNLTDVALELIETGKSIIDQVNIDGNTALIYICYNKMTEVALIETGKANSEQIKQQL